MDSEGLYDSLILKIVDIPHSTYYYRKHYRVEEKKVSEGRPAPDYSTDEDGEKVPDEQIKEFLLELIAGEYSNFGYRKLTKMLRRIYKLQINKKKVYRLCKELGILCPQRRKRIKHPRKNWYEIVLSQHPISFGRLISNMAIFKKKTDFLHLFAY
ncbi:IS3 family transposase [Lentibacillus salinarum]|uniref:IS3 family transposase n=1 Tax=Lentibacillus salinarum TaxID=446820 RepID=A0ABW3ZR12_9BACI